jgi:hypothetical protein
VGQISLLPKIVTPILIAAVGWYGMRMASIQILFWRFCLKVLPTWIVAKKRRFIKIFFAHQSLEGYRLQGGRYVAIPTNDRGLIWSEQLELYLGVWDGNARFFNPAGDRVLMPDEEALLAMQQLEFERQRADRLADRLRSLGVEDI